MIDVRVWASPPEQGGLAAEDHSLGPARRRTFQLLRGGHSGTTSSWIPLHKFAALLACVVIVSSGCSSPQDLGTASGQSSHQVTEQRSAKPLPSATYKPASAKGPAENVPLPDMPAEAKAESKEGLIAFARYWYDLVNYGYESGDLIPIGSQTLGDCRDCSRYEQVITDGYANSDWIFGGQITVWGMDSEYVLTDAGRYQVLVQFSQDRIELRGPNDVLYTEHPGSKHPVVQMLEARWTDAGWVVEELVSL